MRLCAALLAVGDATGAAVASQLQATQAFLLGDANAPAPTLMASAIVPTAFLAPGETNGVALAENSQPIARLDTAVTDEDSAVSGNVLSNDSDSDAADVLRVSSVNGNPTNVGVVVSGTYGDLVLDEDGDWSYTPNAAANALAAGEKVNDTFSYGIGDGHGGGATASLSIEVVGMNDAPVAVANTATAQEEVTTSATGNVLANDTDVDNGDTKTVSAVKGVAGNVGVSVAGTYGTVTINADGSYTYTLNNASAAVQALRAGQTVTDSFAYTMRDAAGATSSTTLAVAVTGTNDGPVAVANTAAVQEDTTTKATGNLLTNDTDADSGDTKTVSEVNGAAGSVGTAVAGAYGTVTINANGSYTYTLNNASAAIQTLGAGQTVTDSFTYTMRDAAGATSSTTLAVTVTGKNDGPVAVANTATAQEEVTTSATGNVLANDTDVDNGDTKTVSAVKGVAGNVGVSVAGTYGTVTINADGSYTYTLNNASAAVQALRAGQTVTDSFAYTMRDAAGATSSTTLAVAVTGTNDGPVAVANTAAVQEDTTTKATGNLLTNDTDADSGDTKTVSEVNGAAGSVGTAVAGAYGTVTINANGSYTYTLNNASAAIQTLGAGQTVTDSFTYTMRDAAGATSSTTLAVTVTGKNDGPVAVANTATAQEEVTTSATGNVLANDTDVDNGDTKTVSAVKGVAGNVGVSVAGTYGTVTINADGSYTYTLNNASAAVQALRAGQTVTDSFAYTMRDAAGATSSTTLAVAVTGTNDGPVAVANTAAVQEDTTTKATGNLLTNDTDADSGDTKTVSEVNGAAGSVGTAVAGAYGTVTINANGSYTYTLNNASAAIQTLGAGQTVTDSFTYTMRDAAGATSSTTLAVTVTGKNDGPVAVANTATAQEEVTTSATGNVLANDTDVDNGDTKTVSAVKGVAGNVGVSVAGTYGTVTINADGSYTYTLNNASAAVQALRAGQTVTDSFAYTMRDAAGATSSTTLAVAVTGTNDGPVALSITNSSAVENAPTGTVVGYATPIEADYNDTLTYSLVGASGPFAIGATNGIITVNGALNYETAPSYNLTVRVTDSAGQYADHITTINVIDAIEGSNSAETLTGTSGDDLIFGLNGNDVITGGGGNDLIVGGVGADNMDGGTGVNTLSYMTSSAGVNVDLGTGAVSGGDAAGDTIANFANLTGSNSADILTGDGGDNVLLGLNGNDTITGGAGTDTIEGGAGSDTLSGGNDVDTLSYASSNAGVAVNLATNVTSGGHAAGDSITGFENVLGSNNNDTLTGNSGANILWGAGGNDTLRGGLGDDRLNGGAGHDLFTYQVGDGNDIIDGGSGASWVDTIQMLDSAGGSNLVYNVDWTVVLSSGTIDNTDAANGVMTFSADADGTINFTAGGSISFSDVERLNW